MTSKKYSIKVDMDYVYSMLGVEKIRVRVYAVTSPHWLARLLGEKPQEIENTSLKSFVGPDPTQEQVADAIHCLEVELLDFMNTQGYVEV